MLPTNAGYHHIRIGDFTVTALNDGVFQGSLELAANVTSAEFEQALRATHRAIPPKLTVNAFLIRDGHRTVLVDTGAGSAMGEAAGHFGRALSSVGVAPSDIDTILMTHLHIDHVGGLTDAEGNAAFPNAELVLNTTEAEYWSDPASVAAAPEDRRWAFDAARQKIAPYKARTRTLTSGEALPGIMIHPIPGHTPGHSGYLISSGGDALLIWGDVVHVPGLQFAYPHAGVRFDTDLAQARAQRQRVFDMAVTEGLRVAGMHLDFPAFGHLAKAADGYAFIPEVWMPA